MAICAGHTNCRPACLASHSTARASASSNSHPLLPLRISSQTHRLFLSQAVRLPSSSRPLLGVDPNIVQATWCSVLLDSTLPPKLRTQTQQHHTRPLPSMLQLEEEARHRTREAAVKHRAEAVTANRRKAAAAKRRGARHRRPSSKFARWMRGIATLLRVESA